MERLRNRRIPDVFSILEICCFIKVENSGIMDTIISR